MIPEPKAQIVSLAQFCERFDLRTPGGKLALRRGRRLLEERFVFFRDGSDLWTTEQELARVFLGPVAAPVINGAGKHYGTGREGTVRAVTEVIEELIARGLVTVNGAALDAAHWKGQAA